ALARFEGVEQAVHGRKTVDHARADRLRDAVGVSPYRDPSGLAKEQGRPAGAALAQPVPAATAAAPAGQASPGMAVDPADRAAVGNDVIGVARPMAADLDLFATQGGIEAGDVVSLT